MISPCGLPWFYVQVTHTYLTRLSPLQAQGSFRLLPDPSHFSASNCSALLYTHGACSTGLGAQLLSALHSPNAQLSEGLDIQSSDNRALARGV